MRDFIRENGRSSRLLARSFHLHFLLDFIYADDVLRLLIGSLAKYSLMASFEWRSPAYSI
jgi:hypothetical protein